MNSPIENRLIQTHKTHHGQFKTQCHGPCQLWHWIAFSCHHSWLKWQFWCFSDVDVAVQAAPYINNNMSDFFFSSHHFLLSFLHYTVCNETVDLTWSHLHINTFQLAWFSPTITTWGSFPNRYHHSDHTSSPFKQVVFTWCFHSTQGASYWREPLLM